jgi:hypothetical protein
LTAFVERALAAFDQKEWGALRDRGRRCLAEDSSSRGVPCLDMLRR